MKRDELKKLLGDAATDEVLDKIMAENGKDIEKFKADVKTAESERDQAKTQLDDANKQIGEFKNLDVDKIKQAATDWEAKAKQAQKEADEKLLAIKRDHALERELRDTFGVSDLVAVRAHLKPDDLKFNEKDESFIGLKEQVEPLKEKHKSYFSSEQPDTDPDPKLVKGKTQQNNNNNNNKKVSLADAIKERLGETKK